jgi:hypothetical protein
MYCGAPAFIRGLKLMRVIKMNKVLQWVAIALTVALCGAQSALAQQAQGKGAPVEFYGCNWQKGMGIEDLVKVGKKFSKWSDENNSMYSAWILTPQYQTNMGFDVGWLGGWPDGAAMGKTQDAWISGGHQLAREFDAVVDCSKRHELATSVAVNAPKGPPGNGIVMFAGCELQDGKSGAEAVAAHKKVAEMMTGKGSKGSSWAFFPGLGNIDTDIDYWQVIAFNNYSEFGAASDIFINGGGWRASADIFRGVTRCGRGVMFDATLVRAADNSQ